MPDEFSAEPPAAYAERLEKPPRDVILRSDVPLWMEDGSEAVAPRSFHSENAFGCISGVSIGDWKLTFFRDPDGYQPEPVWWRVGMAGAIHCNGFFEVGEERGKADLISLTPGYTINLGRDDTTGLDLRLWEIGLRTGSEYLILSKAEGDETNSFNVLDPDCTHGVIRQAPFSHSIARTDYCAVPTQDAMRAIAREAASRPPIGVMEYVGESANDSW